jgi:hypothetical protein
MNNSKTPLPDPDEVLQQCTIAFPGLVWGQLCNSNWQYYDAKSNSFYVELTVQNNGSRAYFYVGDRCWSSSNIQGRSPAQALDEVRAIVLGLARELRSILGEKL